MRFFFLFFVVVFFFSFFSFALLVWKFDVLFVGLFVVVVFRMVTVNRRGRYYY